MGTTAIINLDNFLHNFSVIKSRIGTNCRICVPVKANGYGHGAIEIAKTSLKAGAFCFGVATVAEGTLLRNNGIDAPILIFSNAHPLDIPDIINNDLSPFVSDAEFVDILENKNKGSGKKIQVHLKIDTGMGRMGCTPSDAPALAQKIVSCTTLEYRGTATHFAVSDSSSTGDIDYTRLQLKRFKDSVEKIKALGIDPGILHTANSGGVIMHSDSWFDMVRPGIALYGYKAVEETNAAGLIDPNLVANPLDIKPVMELKTRVVFIKNIKKGETISYGRIWTTNRDTVIATLPVGYADGFPRCVSNNWNVYIGGKPYPQVGRICMDQCLVDLGPDSNVRRWEEVSIFGGFAPDASVLAEKAGTIPYEITCAIHERVPREYRS